MEIEDDIFDSPEFDRVEAIFHSFERRIAPFRKTARKLTEYPYLGEREVRERFDGPRGHEAALMALAMTYLLQTDAERSRWTAEKRDRVGFQGGHAVAGNSLGAALVRYELADCQSPRGWRFDGVTHEEPVAAAIALGRRYAKCLAKGLRQVALALEPPEERERLRKTFGI